MTAVRRYDSPVRAAKARATRAAILAAAQALFIERGYVGANVADIASTAGFSTRTVFNVFPTKAALLREAVIAALLDNTVPPPVVDSEPFEKLLERENALTTPSGLADFATRLHARSASLVEVLRQASAVDVEADEFWRWGRAQLVSDSVNIAGGLATAGWLSPGVDQREVADSVYVLVGHETYYQLVVERGWSLDQYWHWLVRQLLGACGRPPDSDPRYHD